MKGKYSSKSSLRKRISGLVGIVLILAVLSPNMALAQPLWTWGANENGQLRIGTNDSGADPTPVQMSINDSLHAIYEKKSITSELAEKLIDAAEKKAKEIEVPEVIAIVDESGNLKAFRRMDGATFLSIDIAIDKGYTAVAFGSPTDQLYNFIKNDPPLLIGIPKIPKVIVFGGGYPIIEDNETIGGIGVSGGYYKQDMEVAEAALKILK
jgi:uncharacterized protein GlcG (DUF336 family)